MTQYIITDSTGNTRIDAGTHLGQARLSAQTHAEATGLETYLSVNGADEDDFETFATGKPTEIKLSVDIETLIEPARQAIARSEEYDEIVTIEGSKEIHSFLSSECDDSVENGDVTEYWANDPDSDDKMTWRVHVRDNA